MLTQEQILQARQKAGLGAPPTEVTKLPSLKSKFSVVEANPVIETPEKKGPTGTEVVNALDTHVAQPFKESFAAGANRFGKGTQQVIEGVDLRNPDPGKVMHGILNQLGGGLETVFSPITGALSAVSKIPGISDVLKQVKKYAVDQPADAISDLPVVQELVKKYPDLEDDIGNLITIATSVWGGKKAPEIRATADATSQAVGTEARAIISDVSEASKRVATETKKAVDPVITARKAKSAQASAKSVDDLVGQITQGEKADLPAARRTLATIDGENIKTYSDLKTALTDKVEGLTSKLDDELGKDTRSPKLEEWNKKSKVGDKEVSHNFVEDGLNQLKDYYTKANDVVNAERISQLINKAKENGLTIKEVNGIAREHGSNLNAYNANGELSSGLTKQAAENTRTGIKDTARELYGNDAYKATDSAISDTIKTRDLIDAQVEAVNKLNQKIKTRTWGEKVGNLAGKVVNLIGLNSPKGFLEYFLGRGTGLKTLNALDLQRVLQKNLRTLNDVLDRPMSEAQALAKLQSIIDNQSRLSQSRPAGNKEMTPANMENGKKNKNSPTNSDIPKDSTPFVPKSKTVKAFMDYAKNPKAGLSVEKLKVNPADLDSAIFDHLDELRDVVETNHLKSGSVDLEAIDFLDNLGGQKVGDLAPKDRATFYEIAAQHGRQDIVKSINDMVEESIKSSKKK